MIKREELIKHVFSAFKDVRLGNGVGLYEAQAIDYHAPLEKRKEFRSHDETENWIDIPLNELFRFWDSPSFFDAEGMRFHLPMYLLLELEYFEDEIEKMYKEGPVQGTFPDIEFHLTSVLDYLDDDNQQATEMREFEQMRFSLLNEGQISCVIQFLIHKTIDYLENDNQRVFLGRAIQHWENKLNSIK